MAWERSYERGGMRDSITKLKQKQENEYSETDRTESGPGGGEISKRRQGIRLLGLRILVKHG